MQKIGNKKHILFVLFTMKVSDVTVRRQLTFKLLDQRRVSLRPIFVCIDAISDGLHCAPLAVRVVHPLIEVVDGDAGRRDKMFGYQRPDSGTTQVTHAHPGLGTGIREKQHPANIWSVLISN